MILTDTGPLVALIDADDPHHLRCMQIAKQIAVHSLLTTVPCFTEAVYLLGAVGGYVYQEKLWGLYATKRLHLHLSSSDEIDRMNDLMRIYQDRPMDFADTSLIAAAEQLNHKQIFSVDSDFYIYRLIDGRALQLIPS